MMEERVSKEKIFKTLRTSLLSREKEVLFNQKVNHETNLYELKYPDDDLACFADKVNKNGKFIYCNHLYDFIHKFLQITSKNDWLSLNCNEFLSLALKDYLASFNFNVNDTELGITIIQVTAFFTNSNGLLLDYSSFNGLQNSSKPVFIIAEPIQMYSDYGHLQLEQKNNQITLQGYHSYIPLQSETMDNLKDYYFFFVDSGIDDGI